ncbi:fatty acid desaturase family protein [Nocardioides alkalitolerans]|uniref:fatty acid desaturase family protein n=1 Tax=Nocardioides alkalitolerans TaxID=281714 RepID=UPI00041A53E1|nr:acyl-CoA desaturase [Nocardioides alkalitolerans]
MAPRPHGGPVATAPPATSPPAPVDSAPPVARRARRPAAQNLYTDLAREMRESGLLDRAHGYYWSRTVALVAAYVGVWVGVVLLGDSWFQLVLAVALGLLMTQFGFLGHDAAHRQMFRSARWNNGAARVLGGLFAGMSHGWWRAKHNKHHQAPNQEGIDPDIGPGALAFTADIAADRTTGFAGWFTARQGWLFFPLLTLEGLNLHAESIRPLGRPGISRGQRIEAALVGLRLVVYVVALFVLLPPGIAIAFFAVQSAVFGVCLGASFAPSHKGMPIVPPGMQIDFLRRQVLVSRNVRGGLLVDAAMGGLNYQIEHHLFPSMPRPHLKRARPIVKAYCERHDVGYTETGLFESYGIVIDYLNNVGLRARGPFDCPMALTLRDSAVGS